VIKIDHFLPIEASKLDFVELNDNFDSAVLRKKVVKKGAFLGQI